MIKLLRLILCIIFLIIILIISPSVQAQDVFSGFTIVSPHVTHSRSNKVIVSFEIVFDNNDKQLLESLEKTITNLPNQIFQEVLENIEDQNKQLYEYFRVFHDL
ncbi:hypothetical protein HC864_01920 [Candidatus Gracilibacteria bacterium]|nr:hypothetical protein [Candidatus Gracilibacteria bacterium]